MCIMCIEIFKSRMTVEEARKALPELLATTDDAEKLKHYKDLADASDEELLEIAKKSEA